MLLRRLSSVFENIREVCRKNYSSELVTRTSCHGQRLKDPGGYCGPVSERV